MALSAINYIGIAFGLLTFEKGMIFLRATYAYALIGVCVVLFLSRTLGMVAMAKKMEKKSQVGDGKESKKDK